MRASSASCSRLGCWPSRLGCWPSASCGTGAIACSMAARRRRSIAHASRSRPRSIWRPPTIRASATRGVAARSGGPARRHTARHVGLPERDVRNIVVAAYAVASQVGLWTEVAATTGARPRQIARLDVADLQDDRDDPRLMMPSSKKGRGRKRIERRPVPITPGLAAKLRAAAGTRASGAPLLTQPDGARLAATGHVRPFAEAAARAGLAGVTAYALRHSSIIRALLAGVPVRVVAARPRHLRGDARDATIARTSPTTPTPSAGARCSTYSGAAMNRGSPVRLLLKSPNWSRTPPRSKPPSPIHAAGNREAQAAPCKIQDIRSRRTEG